MNILVLLIPKKHGKAGYYKFELGAPLTTQDA